MARVISSQEYSYSDDHIVTDPVEIKAIRRSVSAENRAHERLRQNENPNRVLADYNAELTQILDDFVKDLRSRPG